ncbi:hypothetical protein FB45DRAFT_484075 [Roridomyces roridus]|uniref:Uncharacterized protein n=1 Tax=Roridomyces roridus TaxID=1738132 RepID=A0AAD7C0D2_9AGAR|nr:hypothetical protein FB45DRAFT_484075 [Roridomyces roridus]
MPRDEVWEDNDPALHYIGEWRRDYGSIYHGCSVMRTTRIGDSMTVKFRGALGAQGWDHGSFLVHLDGDAVPVDGQYDAIHEGVPQVVQFSTHGLSRAEHRLTITNDAAGQYGSVLEWMRS